MKNQINRIISDIRFWILLLMLLRLYGITNPPLEVAHNWRQTTVTMVARNFLETDNNIFYPRIDFAGEKTGITGMEFPLLNYIIYLVSLIFGYAHWYGRLINLIVSSAGIYYFYLTIRRVFNHKIALYSSIILLSSIWFSYSRKIMPDTFSMSLLIAGIYYACRYFLDHASIRNLLLYAILICAGVLSKLPSGYILSIPLILFLFSKYPLKQRFLFFLLSIIAIIPSVYWYFVHVPFLVEHYGFWHFFMGKNMILSGSEILANLSDSLKQFYFNALKYSGFILFVFGIVISVRKKQGILLRIFILGFLSFLIVIFKAGFHFSHHSYYIIPFVPLMALVAGYGLSNISKHWIVTLLLIVVVSEGILDQQHDFRIKPSFNAMIKLEEDFDKISSAKDLIIINSSEVPTPMYFAHRKGWIATNEMIASPGYITQLQSKGLKYILILKKVFGSQLQLPYPVVIENENYIIYKPCQVH